MLLGPYVSPSAAYNWSITSLHRGKGVIILTLGVAKIKNENSMSINIGHLSLQEY